MKWANQLCLMCLTATLLNTGPVFALDWPVKYPIARDLPGPYSYETTSRLDLKGVTLHVVVINGTIVHSTERHARQFEELTGATILVHKKTWDTLYGDMMRGIQSGTHDIAMNPQQWLIDLAPYAEPLPKTLLESPQYKAIASPYDAIGLWDDAFIAAMEKDSTIRGKVGVIQSPGSRTVWNRKEKKWDAFPDVNYAPYIAEGWSSVVSAKSKHKGAAFAFLGFFSNEANHRSDLLYGSSGINPFRQSDANVDFWVTQGGWDQDIAASYTTVLSAITNNANRMFFLHLYRGRHYGRKLSSAVFQALSGLIDPRRALAEAAKGWENETRIVGIDEQREAYKNIILLEENRER